MLHENDKIKVHMIDWPRRCEIKTRNYDQVFTVTKDPKNGNLCIDWKRSLAPLVPLTGFAWTVVFENIDNGKLYHNNAALADDVIELAPEYDALRRACAAGIV